MTDYISNAKKKEKDHKAGSVKIVIVLGYVQTLPYCPELKLQIIV